jgi:hypothetical protein
MQGEEIPIVPATDIPAVVRGLAELQSWRARGVRYLRDGEIYESLKLAVAFRTANGNDLGARLDAERVLGLFTVFFPKNGRFDRGAG